MISDMRRLRRSNSSQTTRAKRTRIAAMLCLRRAVGLDPRRRVVDRDARDAQRLGTAELRVAAAMEAPHEEVVDDLLHQIGRILHERHVGLDVADDPEAAEHLLAEAVRPAFPHEPVTTNIAHLVRNNIYVYGIRGEGRSATHRAMELMAEKRFDATKIHTHTFPLADLPTALRYARERVEDAIKVVVTTRQAGAIASAAE